jgi:hypothetical protein
MSWREVITDIYEHRPHQPGCASKPVFYPAASVKDIVYAESQLVAKFPLSLRSMLLESNGVMDMLAIDRAEWSENKWLLWSIAEIIKGNLFCRAQREDGTYERDFRALLFFAGAGFDGILFGFPVGEDHVCAPDVVVWYPIGDEVTGIARSLEDFVSGWLKGTISV